MPRFLRTNYSVSTQQTFFSFWFIFYPFVGFAVISELIHYTAARNSGGVVAHMPLIQVIVPQVMSLKSQLRDSSKVLLRQIFLSLVFWWPTNTISRLSAYNGEDIPLPCCPKLYGVVQAKFTHIVVLGWCVRLQMVKHGTISSNLKLVITFYWRMWRFSTAYHLLLWFFSIWCLQRK